MLFGEGRWRPASCLGQLAGFTAQQQWRARSGQGIFELTLCFEDRGKEFLKLIEFCGSYLLFVEAVAACLLVFVELCGCRRRLRLRYRLQRRENLRSLSF